MSSTSVRRTRRAPHGIEIPALEGIYRYRHLIAGRPAWYAMNATGEMLGFRVVQDEETDVDVVADLVVALRGPDARKPLLRLINGRRSACGVSPSWLSAFADRPRSS